MSDDERARIGEATSRMTVSSDCNRLGKREEWWVQIDTSATIGDRVVLVQASGYASSLEAAFRKAMKQLRWDLRDAPAKVPS